MKLEDIFKIDIPDHLKDRLISTWATIIYLQKELKSDKIAKRDIKKYLGINDQKTISTRVVNLELLGLISTDRFNVFVKKLTGGNSPSYNGANRGKSGNSPSYDGLTSGNSPSYQSSGAGCEQKNVSAEKTNVDKYVDNSQKKDDIYRVPVNINNIYNKTTTTTTTIENPIEVIKREIEEAHKFIKKEVQKIVDLEPENKSAKKIVQNVELDFSKWFLHPAIVHLQEIERVHKITWAVNDLVAQWLDGTITDVQKKQMTFVRKLESYIRSFPKHSRTLDSGPVVEQKTDNTFTLGD